MHLVINQLAILPTQTKFAMNEEVKRNEFDEICAHAIFSLNGLMQTREVCKLGKAVTKINRFKQWVLELQDSVNADAPEITE